MLPSWPWLALPEAPSSGKSLALSPSPALSALQPFNKGRANSQNDQQPQTTSGGNDRTREFVTTISAPFLRHQKGLPEGEGLIAEQLYVHAFRADFHQHLTSLLFAVNARLDLTLMGVSCLAERVWEGAGAAPATAGNTCGPKNLMWRLLENILALMLLTAHPPQQHDRRSARPAP